jgi:hypothetical protein
MAEMGWPEVGEDSEGWGPPISERERGERQLGRQMLGGPREEDGLVEKRKKDEREREMGRGKVK